MAMTTREKASYDKAQRAIKRIKEMHIVSTSPLADQMCQECCDRWPCRTLKALDARP